ncbi:MAG: type II toxin-antitoxin system HicA family toxin [Nitrosomonas sp.]|nr:type II toxin-antitoxin system HicA family toxin [Nitrosomonas sp.]
MGKLRILSGQQLCAILAQHGFIEVRRRGSHIVMQKKMDTQRLPYLYLIIPKYASEHFNPSFANQELPEANSKFCSK